MTFGFIEIGEIWLACKQVLQVTFSFIETSEIWLAWKISLTLWPLMFKCHICKFQSSLATKDSYQHGPNSGIV